MDDHTLDVLFVETTKNVYGVDGRRREVIMNGLQGSCAQKKIIVVNQPLIIMIFPLPPSASLRLSGCLNVSLFLHFLFPSLPFSSLSSIYLSFPLLPFLSISLTSFSFHPPSVPIFNLSHSLPSLSALSSLSSISLSFPLSLYSPFLSLSLSLTTSSFLPSSLPDFIIPPLFPHLLFPLSLFPRSLFLCHSPLFIFSSLSLSLFPLPLFL